MTLISARHAVVGLCLVFFVSGGSALVFETLWFRQAGLALGNTVWASSLVTAAFMGGLAIGNAAAARWGRRVGRPLLAYAALELLVGAAGVGLVLGFPLVGSALAPLMGSLGGATLNVLRVAVAFALLLVPSVAMGATLPLLAAALTAHDENFGRVLGRLYGWNTLGAVAGTLAGDLVLIQALGIRGTALAAAGLNVAAALGAAWLSRRLPAPAQAPPPERLAGEPLGPFAWRLIAAAALAGGLLLALEMVWFRFLIAFTPVTSWAFAVMLAVVLLGIAAGGLAAAELAGRQPHAHRLAAIAPLLAGAAAAACYAGFLAVVPDDSDRMVKSVGGYFHIALPLMLPVSFLSGAFFTLLGRALHEELQEATRSTGLLTLANTTGAMAGALAGAFLMLPTLGVERSLFALACLYGVVALLSLQPGVARGERLVLITGAAVFVGAVALFPFGLMQAQYVPRVVSRWEKERYRPIAYHDGLAETIIMLRNDAFGAPLSYRLVTNGTAMSGTTYAARRYMGMYAWWPVAVHPAPRRALLISYGLGTTARALVETRELERIDVVDTSADVLALSAIAQESPAANPLADPRVQVHVEDGRFFLFTTKERFDIITGEPPPPKAAGIASLYSREFFALARSRLAPGGIVTYWLPVYQLEPPDMRAVVSAFCEVFEACSLWTGHLLELMLVGTNGATGPVDAERFSAQWRDPVVSARLEEAGLNDPAQLGATFLADAPALRELAAGAPPLVDDFPYRLSPRVLPAHDLTPFVPLLQVAEPARRFFESELVRRLWPEPMRQRTRAAFLEIDAMNAAFYGPRDPAKSGLADLDRLLSGTSLRAPVLWVLGTSVAELRLARAAAGRGESSPAGDEVIGLGALASRDYREAERRLGLAEPHAGHAPSIRMWRILALGLAGDRAGAGRLLAEAYSKGLAPGEDAAPWRWLAERFALEDPAGPR